MEPLLKDTKAVAKLGLVFTDDEEPFEISSILQDKMHWKPSRGGGWCVIGEPREYNGENDVILQSFLISKELIHSLIAKADQPPLLNVDLVVNGKDNNTDDESTHGDLIAIQL